MSAADSRRARPLNLARLMVMLFAASATLTVALLLIASALLKSAAVHDLSEAHAREFADLAFRNLYLIMSKGGDRADIADAIDALKAVKPDHVIRVVRGEPVSRQFGPGDESARAVESDHLVRQALEHGNKILDIGDDVIRYVYPVKMEQSCVACHNDARMGEVNGVIDITHPIDDVQISIGPMLQLITGFSLLFLGVLLLVVHLNLRHFVVRPLSGLVDFMRDVIRDPDLRRRVEQTSRVREIGELSESFNHLLESIEDHHRQLEELSNTDPLTKLYNRRKFEQCIGTQIECAKQYNARFSIIVFDLDGFGHINDAHGHPIGDLVLAEVAEVLRKGVSDKDVVARTGEDEFAILLSDATLQKAESMAENLRNEIGVMEFQIDQGTLRVTASLGVVEYPSHGRSGEELTIAADVAISQAKARGRNCVATVNEDEIQKAARSHGRDVWLRRAIAEERVILHAQPIIDLAEDRNFGYEILTRVRDGDRLLSANAFVPDLERQGRIEEFDRFVVERALYMKRQIAALEGAKLFINLAPASIENLKFMQELPRLLHEYRTPPGEVVVEITEREALRQLSAISSLMRELRDDGILFALDDFGSGFNSFLYLKYFPVDFVKIEGSFVRNMARSRRDRLIVEYIHEVSQALGVKTIAERVEDRATHELVRTLSVDFAQGFYYQAATALEGAAGDDPGDAIPRLRHARTGS